MKYHKKEIIILSLMTLLAFILRFYKLGEIPFGFHQDEAFLGYNGYSILKSGRDITGNFLPLHLQSFWYSPALYSYLAMPFLLLFGLSEFAVRFPSALFGSLTIPLVYLFGKSLFKESKFEKSIPLLTSFFLAINPWHINLSRVATENIPVVFFITLGSWIYLYAIQKKRLLFTYVSLCVFFVSLFIYQAPRAFLPFYIPALFFLFPLKTSHREKIRLVAAFILLIVVPLFYVLYSPTLSYRIKSLSILHNPEVQLRIDEQIREDGYAHAPIIFTRIFDNKFIGYTAQFLENFFKHFSYEYYFTDKALPERYRVSGVGLLYIFDIIFIPIGIFFVLKNKVKQGILLVVWIIIGNIGGALTFDAIPNLQRGIIIQPALSLIAALGAFFFLNITVKRFLQKTLMALFILVLSFSFLQYLHKYYIHQQVHQTLYRNEGYSEMIKEVNKLLASGYKKAEITSTEGAVTIFFLHYNTYDPLLFQKNIQNASEDEKTINKVQSRSFGKYIFVEKDCVLSTISRGVGAGIKYYDKGRAEKVYVENGLCPRPSYNIKSVKEIKRKDGTIAFRIITLDEEKL